MIAERSAIDLRQTYEVIAKASWTNPALACAHPRADRIRTRIKDQQIGKGSSVCVSVVPGRSADVREGSDTHTDDLAIGAVA